MDELAETVHALRPAALEVADEIPAERVAVRCVLQLEVLCAVLAHDLDPGLGENGQVVAIDVLRSGDDGHPGPDFLPYALVASAYRLSGQAREHHACRAASRSAVRRRRDRIGSGGRGRAGR